MEKLVAELRKLVRFKDTTEEGDLVLIAAKEPQMLVYALVTGIKRDISRRDEWYHVSMSVLSVPVQPIVWTLRVPQFTGQEIFTMGGEERFIQAVRFDQPPSPGSGKQEKPEKPSPAEGRLRVIK